MSILILLLFFPAMLFADQNLMLQSELSSASDREKIAVKNTCHYCFSPNLASPDLTTIHKKYIKSRSKETDFLLLANINASAENTRNYRTEADIITPVSHSAMKFQAANAEPYDNGQGFKINSGHQTTNLLVQSHLDIGRYTQLDLYAQYQDLSDEVLQQVRREASNASKGAVLINYDVDNLGPLEKLKAQLYLLNRQQHIAKLDPRGYFFSSDRAFEYQEDQIELSVENALFLGFIKLGAGFDLGFHESKGVHDNGAYFLPETTDNHVGTFVTTTLGLDDNSSLSLELNWDYLQRKIDEDTLPAFSPEPSFEHLQHQLGFTLSGRSRLLNDLSVQFTLSSQNEVPEVAQQLINTVSGYSPVLFQGNPDLKLIRNNKIIVSVQGDQGYSARINLDYIRGHVTADYYSAAGPFRDQLTFRSVDALSSTVELRALKPIGLWLAQIDLRIKNVRNLTDGEAETDISPFQAKLGLTYKESNFQFNAQWKYVAEPTKQLQNADGKNIFNNGLSTDYLLTKLSVGLGLGDLWLDASIDNFFNVEYSPYTGNQYLATLGVPDSRYLGQGRNFQLSARYRF